MAECTQLVDKQLEAVWHGLVRVLGLDNSQVDCVPFGQGVTSIIGVLKVLLDGLTQLFKGKGAVDEVRIVIVQRKALEHDWQSFAVSLHRYTDSATDIKEDCQFQPKVITLAAVLDIISIWLCQIRQFSAECWSW
jgi:hypothetical protein